MADRAAVLVEASAEPPVSGRKKAGVPFPDTRSRSVTADRTASLPARSRSAAHLPDRFEPQPDPPEQQQRIVVPHAVPVTGQQPPVQAG